MSRAKPKVPTGPIMYPLDALREIEKDGCPHCGRLVVRYYDGKTLTRCRCRPCGMYWDAEVSE